MKRCYLVALIIVLLGGSLLAQEEDVDALLEKALKFFKKGKFKKARDVLLEAIELKEDFVEALFQLGMVYEKLKNPSEAIISYKRAVNIINEMRVKDLTSAIKEIKNTAEDRLKKIDTFSKEFEKVKADYINELTKLGKKYFRKKWFTQAKSVFREIIRADSSNKSARSYLKKIEKVLASGDIGFFEEEKEEWKNLRKAKWSRVGKGAWGWKKDELLVNTLEGTTQLFCNVFLKSDYSFKFKFKMVKAKNNIAGIMLMFNISNTSFTECHSISVFPNLNKMEIVFHSRGQNSVTARNSSPLKFNKEWNELRLEIKGNATTVFLNNEVIQSGTWNDSKTRAPTDFSGYIGVGVQKGQFKIKDIAYLIGGKK